MRITEINDFGELFNFEEHWKNLLSKSQHSIFSTWEWNTIWWKHFGKDRKLLTLVAEEDGKVLGIAPLMFTQDELFHIRRGRIQFIGSPQTDYHNFIISEQKEKVIRAFLDYVNELDYAWDSIELEQIPQDAENLPLLSLFSKDIKPLETCPYLTLPTSMDNFVENLSYKKRKYVRAGLRKLHSKFNVEFGDYSSENKFAEGMNCLIDLHQKKWNAIGKTGVFCDQRTKDFHMEIAEVFSKKNWLCLHALKLSGVPAAAEYGFTYRQRYYAYLPGLDPQYLDFSVGNMLFVLLVQELIKKGVNTYDFLRGAEQYKAYWNATAKINYQVTINRPGLLEKAKHLCYGGYWFLGCQLAKLAAFRNP